MLPSRISGRGETSSDCEAVGAWVASTAERPTTPLVAKATQAFQRVRGEDSELAELWSDDDASHAAWLATLVDIDQRLAS